MTVMMVAARPVILAGLARTPDPVMAIAAWSVAYATAILFSNPTRGLQQVGITLAVDRPSLLSFNAFSLKVGLALTIPLVAIALTPPGHWFLASIIRTDASLQSAVQMGLILMIFLPVLRAFQNKDRGSSSVGS